jgi:hypothetical protein
MGAAEEISVRHADVLAQLARLLIIATCENAARDRQVAVGCGRLLELSCALTQEARVAWTVKVTDEYAAWFTALIKQDLDSAAQVAQAVAALREEGPTLGRPLVDRLKATKIHHLKELRPGSKGRSEIRIIFAFDPTRSALLLLGGDKAGNWARWYRDNIPLAEQLYIDYTADEED